VEEFEFLPTTVISGPLPQRNRPLPPVHGARERAHHSLELASSGAAGNNESHKFGRLQVCGSD
jgi:hypothetical protein